MALSADDPIARKAVFVLTLLVFSLGFALPGACRAGEELHDPAETEEYLDDASSRKEAHTLIKTLSQGKPTSMESIRLLYEVHMDLEALVKTRMNATLELNRSLADWKALFSLEEPEGKDLWSRFALFVYGRHTDEYKTMESAIEKRIEEICRLTPQGFKTQEFREVLPEEKAYENQTSVKVRFDYTHRVVKFWEDRTQPTPSKSIPYQHQLGPLSAFFNFVLFEPAQTRIPIINALKRTEQVPDPKGGPSDKRKVTFLFGTEQVTLLENRTGEHPRYDYAVYFESPNYLDLIYGRHIYYKIVHEPATGYKVPYSVLLEGLISKSKQSEKERRLKELMEEPLGHETLRERREAVEQMNILAARNVKVYLKKANAAWR